MGLCFFVVVVVGYSYNAFQWTKLQGSKPVWCHSGQWSGIRFLGI